MGVSLVVTIALALQAPAPAPPTPSTLKEYEQRRDSSLGWRRALELREKTFTTCPIRWQDGPVNGIEDVWTDEEANRFVVSSSDRTLWLGDGERLRFQGRLAAVVEHGDVSFTRDGERILLLDDLAGTARLFDARSGDLVAALDAPGQVFMDMTTDADVRTLFTVDTEGEIALFDLTNGERTPARVARLDRALVAATHSATRLLMVTSDGQARLHDAKSGDEIRRFAVADRTFMGGALTPEGDVLLLEANGRSTSFTGKDFVASELAPLAPRGATTWLLGDARAAFRMANQGAELWRIGAPHVAHPWEPHIALGGDGLLDGPRLDVGVRGDRLLAIAIDKNRPWYSLLELSTLRSIGAFESMVPRFDLTGDFLGRVRLCDEGRRLLAWGRSGENGSWLDVLDTVDGAHRHHVDSPERLKSVAPDTSVRRLLLASARKIGRVEFDAPSVEAKLVDAWHGFPIAFLLTRSATKRRSAAPLAEFLRSRSVATILQAGDFHSYPSSFDGSGTQWLTTEMQPDGAPLRLARFDGERRSRTSSFEAPLSSPAVDVELSPDGRFAWVSNLSSGWCLADLEESRVVTTSEGSFFPFFGGHRVFFSRDSELLAVASLDDVRLLSTERGEELAKIDEWGFLPSQVALTEDGKWVATVGTELEASIATCELASSRIVKLGKLPPEVHCLDLRFDDERRVLALCDDGVLRRFEREGCVELARLGVKLASLTDRAALSDDLQEAWTGEANGLLRRWNLKSGEWLEAGALYDEGNATLVFERDGYYSSTGGADDRARIAVNGREIPLSCYAKLLHKPEIVAAAARGETVRKPVLPDPPDLQITGPRAPDVEADHAVVEALVRDRYGVTEISATRDGVAVPSEEVKRALTFEDDGRIGRLALRVELPASGADVHVTLRAQNRRGVLSAPATQLLRRRAPQRELYLLALGVGKYDDERLELKCPMKDVDDLIARFKAQEGPFYDRVHVERLADREVTIAAVQRLRERFLQRAREQDTIVVFVAGHGLRTESNEYWFLTSGATPSDPFSGIDRASLERLVTWDRLHAQRRVLLLDTCFSGGTLDQTARGVTSLVTQKDVDAVAAAGRKDAGGNPESSRKGVYVLAASSDHELAREQGGNGLFTSALLHGLDGEADRAPNGNGDGYVSIDELQRFAAAKVHEWSGGTQETTQARVEAGEGFRLARVVAPPKAER